MEHFIDKGSLISKIQKVQKFPISISIFDRILLKPFSFKHDLFWSKQFQWIKTFVLSTPDKGALAQSKTPIITTVSALKMSSYTFRCHLATIHNGQHLLATFWLNPVKRILMPLLINSKWHCPLPRSDEETAQLIKGPCWEDFVVGPVSLLLPLLCF